ncbi:MAG TPA: hypothetical protein VK808_03125 [Bacteroidia bacterium]|nr:hypothetical protein [Bacteroidia bacterium]
MGTTETLTLHEVAFLYLKDIKESNLLPFKDKRSFKKWFASHNVQLLGQGKRLFVLKLQLMRALLEDRIKEVKKTFGKDWRTAIQSEMDLYSNYLSLINTPFDNESAITSPIVPLYSMQNNEPIEIPNKSQRVPGVCLWCPICRTEPSVHCGHPEHRKRKVEYCNDGKLCYKVKFKGGDGRLKTKLIPVNTYEEAILAKIQLGKEQAEPNPKKIEIPVLKNTSRASFPLLLDLIKEYCDQRSDKNVAKHLEENLSPQYLKDIKRTFSTLIEGLEFHNIPTQTFSSNQFNDKIVGLIHEYLLNEKQFSARSYNKYMDSLKRFERWVSDAGHDIEKCFKKVKLLPLNPEPKAISQEEFEALLKVTTEENDIAFTPGKAKSMRHYYFDFLQFAWKISLATGARRQELANLSHSCVIEKDGVPRLLKFENYKVNNIRHLSGNAKKYHYIPVTKSLYSLLIESGYETCKKTGVDSYLIAPSITKNRDKVIPNILSRSFSHFYSKTGFTRDLSFGSIRKRYITDLELFTKGKAETVTEHSGRGVLNHYLDKEILAEAAQNFEPFAEKAKTRENELNQVREKSIHTIDSLER